MQSISNRWSDGCDRTKSSRFTALIRNRLRVHMRFHQTQWYFCVGLQGVHIVSEMLHTMPWNHPMLDVWWTRVAYLIDHSMQIEWFSHSKSVRGIIMVKSNIVSRTSIILSFEIHTGVRVRQSLVARKGTLTGEKKGKKRGANKTKQKKRLPVICRCIQWDWRIQNGAKKKALPKLREAGPLRPAREPYWRARYSSGSFKFQLPSCFQEPGTGRHSR